MTINKKDWFRRSRRTSSPLTEFSSRSPFPGCSDFRSYSGPRNIYWNNHDSYERAFEFEPYQPTFVSRFEDPLRLGFIRPYSRASGRNSGQGDPDSSGGGTMNCGTCFAKYLLCLFNFVLFLTGGLVLALGVWLYFDKDSLIAIMNTIHENIVPQLSILSQPFVMTYIAYILMATGGFVFIMSLLGYCGALRESKCLLGFYGFLVFVILLLEITAVCMAFIYKDRAEGVVKDFLKSTIKDYYVTTDYSHPDINKGPTAVWDGIMVKMSCCGVNDYKDFAESTNFTNSGLKVPPACCRLNGTSSLLDPSCPKNPKQENSYYLTGCYPTLMNSVSEHMNIVIYCIIGVVLVELLTAFFAICLCKTLEPPYDK